ncbi:iron-containing alcohol dehydrogenase [Chloroflexota bacterium]
MIDQVSMFMCKTELFHGFGSASLSGKQAARFGITRALLVTDRGVRGSGLLQSIEDSLQSYEINYDIFDEVEEDPDIETIHKGTVRLKESDRNGIIVVGGGSPMCTGRGIALEATNQGRVPDYEGFKKYKVSPLPVICLPTTAGSGSDVSRTFVFHDASRHRAGIVVGDDLAPPVSILDPLLLKTCPPQQMVISGLHALCDAIEALWANKGFYLTDVIAYESIRLIMGNLKEASLTNNMEAKSIQLLASSMANIASGNAGLGIVHAMAGSYEVKLPHGYQIGILLPYVMEFNLPMCERKLAQMALTLGEPPYGKNISDLAKLALRRLKAFFIELDLPRKFEPADFPVDKIPELAISAMEKRELIESNIRKLTESDIVSLYEASLQGWQLD